MRTMLILVAILSCISCSMTPKPSADQITCQRQMQSDHLWVELARRVAADVKSELEARFSKKPAQEIGKFGHDFVRKDKGTVFIDDRDDSVFGNALRSFLITELVKEGIDVTIKNNGDYLLDWSCHTIQLKDDQKQASKLISTQVQGFPSSIFWCSDVPPGRPQLKMHIIFRLRDNQTDLLRDSNVFYVAAEDIKHYSEIADTPIEQLDTGPVLSDSQTK